LRVVLDSSALLAVLRSEPGRERVAGRLNGAAMSSVNLCEVLTKTVDDGGAVNDVVGRLYELGIEFIEFDDISGTEAADLREKTRAHGLSLGDRACLALAKRLGGVALTADRAWAEVDAGVAVELIR
jgi:ribonuclease VapC